MFSLPLITPREDTTPWFTPHHQLTSPPNPDTNPSTQQPPFNNTIRRQQNTPLSALALLTQDENTLAQRKLNVRRFGAGWIRPPGIAKTYQATMDEVAEREEQETLARREQQMQELAEAQEMQGQEGGLDGAGEDEGPAERDLDDDVPDMDEAADEGDVTFNEESLLEGSMVEGMDVAEVEHMLELEEAEMTGVLQDERDLSALRYEHDLDDDVPEAGSYQHTDTELEDESSEVGEVGSASVVRMSRGEVRRSLLSEPAGDSLGLGSSILASSVLGSSPAAQRGSNASRRGMRDRYPASRRYAVGP